MTRTNGLPPQAYTRETLSKAYEWLNSQPNSVKQVAKDSSTLVALYLNDVRRSQEGFDSSTDPKEFSAAQFDPAPVSGEHFKSELKNLAVGLDEFSPAKDQMDSSDSSPNHQASSYQAPSYQAPNHQAPSHRASTQTGQQRASQSYSSSSGAEAPSSHQNHYMQNPNFNPSEKEPSPPNPNQAPNPTWPPHVKRRHWESSQHGLHASASSSNRAQGPSLGALMDPASQYKLRLVREQLNLGSENEALRMLISLGFDRVKDILPVD